MNRLSIPAISGVRGKLAHLTGATRPLADVPNVRRVGITTVACNREAMGE